MAGSRERVGELCSLSLLGEGDRLHEHAAGLMGAMRRLGEAPPGSVESYALLRRIMPLRSTRGRQQDWTLDEQTGLNGCRVMKELLAELDAEVAGEMDAVARAVAGPVLGALRDFALGYAEQRRRQGRAEFHDLLIWARDLLRDNLEIRDHFRNKFSHVLIDEAQDTDPIQTEIAMFLAESVPDGAAEHPLADLYSWL